MKPVPNDGDRIPELRLGQPDAVHRAGERLPQRVLDRHARRHGLRVALFHDNVVGVARPAQHRHPVARLEPSDPGSDVDDHAGRLVAERGGQPVPNRVAEERVYVACAYAASSDPDEDLPLAQRPHPLLPQLEPTFFHKVGDPTLHGASSRSSLISVFPREKVI